MKKEKQDLSLERAVQHACEQRNRLRTVYGASPAAMVFGLSPAQFGIADEPHGVRPDGPQRHMEDMEIRVMAAKAFYEANNSSTIRRALLARSRKEQTPLQVGDYAYYWRTGNDKLEPSRWRGPALVCAVEPRETNGIFRPAIYWLAHGCSLVRAAPEHVRLEVSSERAERLQQFPTTAQRQPLQQQLLQALRPVRGPIRFLDLPPGAHPSDAGMDLAGSAGCRPGGIGFSPSDLSPSQPDPAAEATPDEPSTSSTAAAKDEKKRRKKEQDREDRRKEKAREHEEKKEKLRLKAEAQIGETIAAAEAEKDAPAAMEEEPMGDAKRDRSRSPPPMDAVRKSYEQARLLDGLPAKGPATNEQLTRSQAWNADDALHLEEEFLAEEFDERHLTAEEKKLFDAAKNKALMVWIENSAWKAVDATEAAEGEVVPARFLQRWKRISDGPQANARVIIQGFKHKDVLEKQLETESPTLSRIGRMLIYVMATHRRWKLFSADVKSAFMQANSIDDCTRIYVKPTNDMRRRLERLMGLQHHQILKATKPAFGDVRAPRQWFDTADGVMIHNLIFYHHPLDRCVFLSAREACAEDDSFLVFSDKGKSWIVDGVLGLHVDDYIGAGEGVFSLGDLEGEYDGSFKTFRDRLCGLSRRFRFGSWSFGSNMNFCGAQVEQSLDFETVQISMADYIKKVKPITVDKHRKTMSAEPCTPSEQKSLRAIVGAMAWPANQCIPQVSATCSLLQAAVADPKILDLVEANKGLRFLKEVGKDFKLQIHRHCDVSELRFGVYSDAAWAVRPDTTSQGGYLVFAASRQEIEEGLAMKLSIVDWSSKKLARVCRSSLSSEAQAATAAIDTLEWIRIFWSLLLWPTLRYEEDAILSKTGESPILTDAKALYDAVKNLAAANKVSDRRTAIEVNIIRDRLQALGSKMRWLNSSQQLADGLTKRQAREHFAYLLQRGIHRLVFDSEFTAAKKVQKSEKESQQAEMEELAKTMFDGQVFMAEEEHKDESVCKLVGCFAKVNTSNDKNKFCSRRHYYLDHHRRFGPSDPWKKSAMRALAIVAASENCGVEAAETGELVKQEEDSWKFWVTVAVIFIFAIFGVYDFLRKLKDVVASVYDMIKDKFAVFVNVQRVTNNMDQANVQISQNDMVHVETYAVRSHGVGVSSAESSAAVVAFVDAASGEHIAIPDLVSILPSQIVVMQALEAAKMIRLRSLCRRRMDKLIPCVIIMMFTGLERITDSGSGRASIAVGAKKFQSHSAQRDRIRETVHPEIPTLCIHQLRDM